MEEFKMDMIAVPDEENPKREISNERLIILLTNTLIAIEEKVFDGISNEEFIEWMGEEIGTTEEESSILMKKIIGVTG